MERMRRDGWFLKVNPSYTIVAAQGKLLNRL